MQLRPTPRQLQQPRLQPAARREQHQLLHQPPRCQHQQLSKRLQQLCTAARRLHCRLRVARYQHLSCRRFLRMQLRWRRRKNGRSFATASNFVRATPCVALPIPSQTHLAWSRASASSARRQCVRFLPSGCRACALHGLHRWAQPRALEQLRQALQGGRKHLIWRGAWWLRQRWARSQQGLPNGIWADTLKGVFTLIGFSSRNSEVVVVVQ